MDDNLLRAQTALIVLRLQHGRTDGFADLVRLWDRRLFYFIRRLLSIEEDAWDVLQQTWISVYSNIRQLKDPSAFPAWVYRIARRCSVSHLRKQQRQELQREHELAQDGEGGLEEQVFLEREAERIHRSLGCLPLPQREALTLFFLEGFSLREIGEITGVSPGTVKSRLHYGKKELRAILESEEWCDG